MARYIWDLAFSFDHRPKLDGTYDLQIGLVKEVKGGGTVLASPINMKKQDTVEFSLFDLTKEGSWEKTQLHAVIVEFSAAKKEGRNTPFDAMDVVLTPSFTLHDKTAESIYFGGPYPWHRCDAKWTIHDDAGGHHCEMTVTVIVSKKDKNGKVDARRFIVDPEMIIDSQGL